jgi:sugar lactone lactonase YvrE
VLNHRHHEHYVQKFDTSGQLMLEWGANGTGPGEFIGPSNGGPDSIAVDGSGNVYATDPGNYRVQKFDPRGNFLRAFGSIGQGPGQFISGPYGLAVDGVGNVYASDLTGTVQKFDGSSGRVLARWPKTGATRLIALDYEGNLLIRDETKDRSIVKYRQSD